MTTQTLERTEGLAVLNQAISQIKATIEDAGGMFNIQQQVSTAATAYYTISFNHY